MRQLVESVLDHCNPQGPVIIRASFDEFNLDLAMSYNGTTLELTDTRPSTEEIRETDDGLRRLAGYMLKRNSDRADSKQTGDISLLQFHFDH